MTEEEKERYLKNSGENSTLSNLICLSIYCVLIFYFILFVWGFLAGILGHDYLTFSLTGKSEDFGECSKPPKTRIEIIRNYTTLFRFNCWLTEEIR